MPKSSKCYVIFRCLLLTPLFILVVSCTTHSTQISNVAEGDHFSKDYDVTNFQQNHSGILKVITLNIAHGRKSAINQLLLSREQIEKNLLEVSAVLTKHNADVVALQEADGPSGWSGNFDHIKLIAKQAGYPWYYRADHARSWLFSYGTAVLSRLPISETIEHTFTPSPPTLNKGFLLSKLIWNPYGSDQKPITIDIISVHLDFSRKKVRKQQTKEMAEVLTQRKNPMIILGDFNSDWFSDESVVKQLVEKTKMKVYKPNANNLYTYTKRGARFDWVLISNELKFSSYQVIPDVISDHLAVVAEVKLIN